jgi:predicted nucleic acid-binding Zn finger protein
VESREFRQRELFEEPPDEARLFPPDERAERAQDLIRSNAIPFAQCEPQETRKTKRLKTPDGPVVREIVYRDWRVTGTVGQDRTEIVVSDTDRILFGTCSCAFFQENLMGRGPCEHMLALFQVSAEGRQDLPTSVPADENAMSASPRSRLADDGEEEPEEESFDEEDQEENDDER